MYLEPVRKIQFLQFFQGLNTALDEQNEKGTPAGDTAYVGIFDELTADLSRIGKDHIADYADHYGHLSTYERLRGLLTVQQPSKEQTAIELFNVQLDKIQSLKFQGSDDPGFILWRDNVKELFHRFLRPDSAHAITFKALHFFELTVVSDFPTGNYAAAEARRAERDAATFRSGCLKAAACIHGAIENIRNFGVHQAEEKKPRPSQSGNINQFFLSSVDIRNQALATGSAVQHATQTSTAGVSGPDLQAIAELLQESMELSRRDIVEGLKAIEVIANQVSQPPEKKDWKTTLEYGEKILSIANKATDFAVKIGPHLPFIVSLVDMARKLGS